MLSAIEEMPVISKISSTVCLCAQSGCLPVLGWQGLVMKQNVAGTLPFPRMASVIEVRILPCIRESMIKATNQLSSSLFLNVG